MEVRRERRKRQCETALSSLIPRKSISMRSSLTCCCVDHSSLLQVQCRTVLSSVMPGPKRTSILQGRRSTFPRVCVRLSCVFPAKTGSPSLLLPIHGQSRTHSQGSTVCATAYCSGRMMSFMRRLGAKNASCSIQKLCRTHSLVQVCRLTYRLTRHKEQD